MSFGGGGSGGGTLSGDSDVALNNPANTQVLTFDGTLGKWKNLNVTVASVAGRTGTVVLTKSDVGLGNVDNTSDATKNAATGTLTNKDLSAGTNTFPTFNQNTTGNAATATISTAANGLKSATTTVVVSGSAAPSSGQVLTATGTSGASWQTPSGGGVVDYSTIPAGSTITVAKSGGSWPVRPTSRTDIVVQWKGPDPSPAIVSSGTGGMMDNVDIRFVTP